MAYIFQITQSDSDYIVDFIHDNITLFTAEPCASADEAKALIETIRMQTPMAAVKGPD